MMRRMFIVLMGIALSGCGSANWTVSQSKFYKYQNHDVRVAAKVSLSRKGHSLKGDDGTDLKMRLYTANYGAVLTEVTQHVGESLASSGTVNVPEIDTIAISDFRLGGTPNTYQDFCAEILMEDSNVPDWRRIGCVNYVDTPSESPTGGVEFL